MRNALNTQRVSSPILPTARMTWKRTRARRNPCPTWRGNSRRNSITQNERKCTSLPWLFISMEHSVLEKFFLRCLLSQYYPMSVSYPILLHLIFWLTQDIFQSFNGVQTKSDWPGRRNFQPQVIKSIDSMQYNHIYPTKCRPFSDHDDFLPSSLLSAPSFSLSLSLCPSLSLHPSNVQHEQYPRPEAY